MKQKRWDINRRSFLKKAVSTYAVPYFVPAAVLGRDAKPSPSNQITMGMIGLGSMGMRHVKGFLPEQDCRILAVCDVDAKRREAAIKEINHQYQNQDCAAYNDFRELIARQDIDTLCIAVPDHWHAGMAIVGAQARKDIYGEKPLALTIAQGQTLCNVVKRYNIVWQTGSWQRSTAHFRFACELVRNQRIGKLQKVEVGIGIGFKPGGGKPTVMQIDPQPVMTVPQELDYDMWLGPAPWAPYTQKRCHWNFRWILDYSGGQVTDWGAHHIDIAHWGMGADDTGPIAVEGKGIFPTDGLWDAASEYDFTCTYANDVVMQVGSTNHYAQGVRWIGPDGWVHVTRGGLKTYPKNLVREKIGLNEIHLSKPAGDHRQGHRRDFLDCVKTRAQTISPVQIGHRSAAVCHLGNIAMLLGRKIIWEPNRQQFTNDHTANRMIRRAIRSPWDL